VTVVGVMNFEILWLNFRLYLNKKSETIGNRGNRPEGTRVTWKIDTQATENVGVDGWNLENTFSKTTLPLHFIKKKYSSRLSNSYFK
jgi:hypothetical protein